MAMYVSPEEYLEAERVAPERSEYVSGEIIRRRLSPRHALLGANLACNIGNRLQRAGCHVFGSLLRVCIRWGSLIIYPDVTVLCGKPEYTDEKRDTVTNPILIAEVLSPPVKRYDRGENSRLFRMVPSLREFLLVERDATEVEHWRRLPNGNWELATVRDSGVTLHLESIGCDLPVDEIYRGTETL